MIHRQVAWFFNGVSYASLISTWEFHFKTHFSVIETATKGLLIGKIHSPTASFEYLLPPTDRQQD
jgi:hypothetical protein